MPLLRIQSYPGVRQIFIASEEISHLATIAITEVGSKYVELGRNADQALVCGVSYGAVSGTVSGKVIRAVTEGIVSGVICALAVNAGDRVTCASAGKITPLNTVTPAGAISGYIPAPLVHLASGLIGGNLTAQTTPSGALGWTSGIASGLTGVQAPQFSSGVFVGTAFTTARVLGKALASGGAGSGIPILVTLGG